MTATSAARIGAEEASSRTTATRPSARTHAIMQETLQTPGWPLDATTRAFFEPRFGHDFSRVRVHADAAAADSARALQAAAFTTGNSLVFGAGRFAPATPDGRQLLAHELTHVVQQKDAPATAANAVAPTESREEREAAEIGRRALRPDRDLRPAALAEGGPARIYRQPAESAAPTDEADSGEQSEAPDFGSMPIIWFRFNSDQLRQDEEVQANVHVSLALDRIRAHAKIAGDAQRIVLHGYASREGEEKHNLVLSLQRARRVRGLLVAAGIPATHITEVAHGPDATLSGRRWNRRVEFELQPLPSTENFSEAEGASIVGQAPRTGPIPLESTRNVLTPSHWALRNRPRITSDPVEKWNELDAAKTKGQRIVSGISVHLRDFKDRWVHAHRAVITSAATEYDLPAWFLAGVAWAEVGGDPPVLDTLAYTYRRDIGVGSRAPELTSFGDVSIQLRRAAEELGYDPAAMTELQKSFLISSLEDPQQNLFLVASHLDRLRDQDFPGKPADVLTDDDLKVIGARYNRGPNLTRAEIDQNLSYGNDVVRKRARLEQLLQE